MNVTWKSTSRHQCHAGYWLDSNKHWLLHCLLFSSRVESDFEGRLPFKCWMRSWKNNYLVILFLKNMLWCCFFLIINRCMNMECGTQRKCYELILWKRDQSSVLQGQATSTTGKTNSPWQWVMSHVALVIMPYPRTTRSLSQLRRVSWGRNDW